MARYIGERWNELYYLRNDGIVYVNAGPTIENVHE